MDGFWIWLKMNFVKASEWQRSSLQFRQIVFCFELQARDWNKLSGFELIRQPRIDQRSIAKYHAAGKRIIDLARAPSTLSLRLHRLVHSCMSPHLHPSVHPSWTRAVIEHRGMAELANLYYTKRCSPVARRKTPVFSALSSRLSSHRVKPLKDSRGNLRVLGDERDFGLHILFLRDLKRPLSNSFQLLDPKLNPANTWGRTILSPFEADGFELLWSESQLCLISRRKKGKIQTKYAPWSLKSQASSFILGASKPPESLESRKRLFRSLLIKFAWHHTNRSGCPNALIHSCIRLEASSAVCHVFGLTFFSLPRPPTRCEGSSNLRPQ